jgi:hypothetical protein
LIGLSPEGRHASVAGAAIKARRQGFDVMDDEQTVFKVSSQEEDIAYKFEQYNRFPPRWLTMGKACRHADGG